MHTTMTVYKAIAAVDKSALCALPGQEGVAEGVRRVSMRSLVWQKGVRNLEKRIRPSRARGYSNVIRAKIVPLRILRRRFDEG